MKIQFDPDLQYQRDAIDAVVDIFRGQEIAQTNFTVAPLTSPAVAPASAEEQGKLPLGVTTEQLGLPLGMQQTDIGIGNRLLLLEEDILANVREIQLRNALPPSEALDGLNFTVEMETGTGKTYVYLRTIFELNKQYGFTKFIIVVPSIAIKEGVKKSIEMTEDHFKMLYDNVRFDYFEYDSSNLGQVRNFATSDCIEIMIINIDAFRRSFTDPEQEHRANIIHRHHDRMAGHRPIEFIQATNPIVIIDEPQSVDTTQKSKEAIASLNPLCTLRYSATHVDKYNMVYKLDSVDAYEQQLVKQIEVVGIEVLGGHNKGYIKLLSVDNSRSPIRARIELDVLSNGRVRRATRTVRSGDDLQEISGDRDVYAGYIIQEISAAEGNEYISFTSQPEIVRLGMAINDVNNDAFKRLQIRRTIEEHLDKEMILRPQGIKVLSLFFIDRVANYRWYDDEGNPQPGKYVRMFEEEYAKAIRSPKYSTLFEGADLDTAAEEVHDGYFAIDRRRTDSQGDRLLRESRGAGVTMADESAYELIMRDKERLLSFDSKLKFIFSHSALREGWDNPNVFQICTLNETRSTMTKRQQIGRGMRIAVNQDGERVHGFDVNRLTIIANESFEQFAKQLQTEMERETGIKFGVVEKHLFAHIRIETIAGETAYLGVEQSEQLWEHLLEHEYIDERGRVQDALRSALKEGDLDLPVAVSNYKEQITAELRKVAGELNIRNVADRRRVALNKARYLSDDFKQLWERIKHRTTFQVEFDVEKLVKECADEIRTELMVSPTRLRFQKAPLDIGRGGITAEAISDRTTFYEESHQLPDIVSYLQNVTNLTRRSIVDILVRSNRLNDFRKNPQQFIERVAEIIQRRMQHFIVDGIKYEKIGDEHYYAQELFEDNELFGYLNRNMIESEKSIHEYVVYDSDVERDFARFFERNESVKLYTKLPRWFKIDTPLGGYNPDWAVLVDEDGEERLFFVVETKSSLFAVDRRATENAKVDCGKAHFRALDEDVDFEVVNTPEAFEEWVLAAGKT